MYALKLSVAYSSICIVHNNADRIAESAKTGTKVFV
jgi:hypothetical protein